ncbi:signal peptidase I [Nostocoides sp. F2B08]|uniref:signal peptidase I n=1 Tax=Nostocoides sp. F2B08 TaxID=2653936 RepID=UPI0012633809|nr:signal peptidase I [Tetrasphaera sp. F2B08]KAB7746002.1 signal peptidase I [Tetrasphaera sp. F2B08]
MRTSGLVSPGSRWLVATAVVVLTIIVIRTWLLTPFTVVSDSMSPTLPTGSTILVERISRYWVEIDAQDLVLLELDDGPTVKRVVGVGGDRIEILDAVLHVNGEPVREDYVDSVTLDGVFFGPVDVPPGHVFVLGDNRFDSIDSRSFGPVSQDRVRGRVIVLG